MICIKVPPFSSSYLRLGLLAAV